MFSGLYMYIDHYLLSSYIVSNVHLCSILTKVRENVGMAISSTNMKWSLTSLYNHAYMYMKFRRLIPTYTANPRPNREVN